MGRIIGQIEMFVLLWVALLSSWWDSHAEADAPVLGQPYCFRGFCVQHSEGQITSEAGLCAVIHCSFSTPSYFDTSALIWYKCEAGQRCTDSDVIFYSKNKNKVQSSFAGRVSLLEPDLNQRNCSIIINDLDLSDSGSYQLQIHSNEDRWRFNTRAFVSVKALQQKPTVRTPALTEGQQASLTCTAPGLCSGSEPNITWTWRRAGEKAPPTIATATTDSLTDVHKRHSSTLEFTPSAELQGTELTCTVSFPHQTTEETVTMNVTFHPQILPTIRTDAADPQGFVTQNGCVPVILVSVTVVSLILNLIFIGILLFQWFSSKKKKPNQEDRLYASLQKTNTSSEYEVITPSFRS